MIKTQVCNKCLSEKPLDDFYMDTRKNGMKHHRTICKECHKKKVHQYEKKNRDKINARRRAEGSAYKKWREQYDAIHKEHQKKQERTWRQTPAGVWCSVHSRAVKHNIPFGVDRDAFINWYIETPKICEYCGIDVESNKAYRGHNSIRLTIDRKDSNAGYTMDNIVLSCAICNTTKSNVLTYEQMLIVGDMIKMNRINNLILPSYRNGKDALREAFPSELSGMYDQSEVGVEVST